MAKKKTNTNLEEQDFASMSGKQNLNEDKTQKKDANLLAYSNSPQEPNEDRVDTDLTDLGYCQVNDESAEDADDELDSSDDDDYKEVGPLVITKTKTDSDQVRLSTNHREQNTQITTPTQVSVKREANIAQAGKSSSETGHTAQLASKHNLLRASTPYPKLSSVHRGSEFLHPPPTLRRRKGSETLREIPSDSASDSSIMSSNTDPTPNQRDKMAENGSNEHIFSGSNDQAPKPSTKARTVLGYVDDDKTNAKKSVIDVATSPKVTDEKKSIRKLFQRKGTKEPNTPPPSGDTAGRRIISAPTLINASPNAKELLNSASSIVNNSPSAKHVVNFSRPIARHSSSDVSNGSPVMRGSSHTPLHTSKSFAGPGAISEGLTDNLNIPLINHHSYLSIVDQNDGVDGQNGTIDPLPKEKNTDASNSDSFNPSDYSGEENIVQQADAVPIKFSGRAKRVDIRPPHGTKNAAPSNRSAMSTSLTPSQKQLTDHDAEVLGAQDAGHYYNNAMGPGSRPGDFITEDPFVDPPFRPLLAKPANEIAAREMARIKDEREAGKKSGGLMGRMNALRGKNDAKPGPQRHAESTGPLPQMRTYKKANPEKEEQKQGSGEEMARNVGADVGRGIQEEREIHAMIEAKLAAKDAANGGRGAKIPRIDYGPPRVGTALRGNPPSDVDTATARGRFEGY